MKTHLSNKTAIALVIFTGVVDFHFLDSVVSTTAGKQALNIIFQKIKRFPLECDMQN